MEKNIRKSRGEIREKEIEIGKLKEKCDQHLKTIEELREVIRQHEANSTSLQKQNTGNKVFTIIKILILILMIIYIYFLIIPLTHLLNRLLIYSSHSISKSSFSR